MRWEPNSTLVIISPTDLQTRLFMTEQVDSYALPLLEGKCFVLGKNEVTSLDLVDHFYIDGWAESIDIHDLGDLLGLQARPLIVCKRCARAAVREQEEIRNYRTFNAPLRAMELFAGE
jgi:hypothetical protein